MFTAAAESFLKQARYPGWGVEVPVEGRRAPLGRGGGGGVLPAVRGLGLAGPRLRGEPGPGSASPWRGVCEGCGGPFLQPWAPEEGREPAAVGVPTPAVPPGRSGRRSCKDSPPESPPSCRARSWAPRPRTVSRGCTSPSPPPSTPASEWPCVSLSSARSKALFS